MFMSVCVCGDSHSGGEAGSGGVCTTGGADSSIEEGEAGSVGVAGAVSVVCGAALTSGAGGVGASAVTSVSGASGIVSEVLDCSEAHPIAMAIAPNAIGVDNRHRTVEMLIFDPHAAVFKLYPTKRLQKGFANATIALANPPMADDILALICI